MNSPVDNFFATLITTDRRKSDPIYLQIAYQFINAVRANKISEETKIPGSRTLAKELKLHRKTVIAALEELKSQGWLRSVPAVGTFVENPEKSSSTQFQNLSLIDSEAFHVRKNFVLDSISEIHEYPAHFTDGTSDYRIVKIQELSAFYTSALRKKNVVKKMSQPQGNLFFRKQLAIYINTTLGLHISENHLLNVQNKEILLYILGQILIQQGDIILVSEYSYPFASMIFQQVGAIVKTVPSDAGGICTNFIKDNFKNGEIKCVYIQPEHQYPTTVSLSEERRSTLIELSKEYGFVIIEDSGDAQINFKRNSPLTLLKKANGSNILYLGNFGNFLPREFQCSFLLCAKEIIQEAKKYVRLFGPMDYLKEQAFAEMIFAGDIHRFHRRALKVYNERARLFASLLEKHFAPHIQFTMPEGGFAFWIEILKEGSLFELRQNAANHGLFIPFGCLYQNKNTTAMRLGYAHLNNEEIEHALGILKKAFEETFS